jgi:hypothetical protein
MFRLTECVTTEACNIYTQLRKREDLEKGEVGEEHFLNRWMVEVERNIGGYGI